jgi:GNAT superfamily N-acetyltransferase
MKLYPILFEEVQGLEIVLLRGCEEDSFEVDLENGDVKDCTEISDDLERMFRSSGVRIMSNENPYSALIDSEGKVYGGLVVSYELPEDYDEFEHGGGVITFSVVVDPTVRGQRLAEKLINDLISSNGRSVIKAQVINPLMEKILNSLGFEKVSETGSREGLVYERKPK